MLSFKSGCILYINKQMQERGGVLSQAPRNERNEGEEDTRGSRDCMLRLCIMGGRHDAVAVNTH